MKVSSDIYFNVASWFPGNGGKLTNFTFSCFCYFQSEAFTGEGDVTFYDADDLDVQWYGRQCSRFQRNITLPGEEEKYSDILGRQKLNKEYPG